MNRSQPSSAPTATTYPGVPVGPTFPDGPTPRQISVAVVLLGATFFTATTMGAFWSMAMSTSILTELPGWTNLETIRVVWTNPSLLGRGLMFSLPLLFILLCHEMGHYLTARRCGLRVTPPYFLPFPVALGTLGAFIRIRSPIRNKRELFDVGVAGPIAGFVALVPFLLIGVALSTPSEVIVRELPPADQLVEVLYVPGGSLAMTAATWIFHGPLPSGWVLDLHPMALAAWVGLLATALNLLPLAQLDGGHILYAVLGRRQRQVAVPLWVLLLVASWWWTGWLLWALIVLILGLIHPPVFDEALPLDRRRKLLAGCALLLLVLCFMPVPLDVLILG